MIIIVILITVLAEEATGKSPTCQHVGGWEGQYWYSGGPGSSFLLEAKRDV